MVYERSISAKKPKGDLNFNH